MRPLLIAGLAWQDYRREARLSACSVLALVAVIAPLLVLFGLKFGLVSSLTERLQRDPAVREIIALGGLLDDNERRTIQKIPLLGDIPFVGNFFKVERSTRSKTELYIVITPRIVRHRRFSTDSDRDSATRVIDQENQN